MPHYNTDRAQQRRCAAFATLQAMLPQSDLLDSLWLLQEHHQAEDMSGIMAYINAVAQRFNLPAELRKQLYQEYFRWLRASPEQLPGDPWQMMLAHRAPPVAEAPAATIIAQPAAVQPLEPLPAELCVFDSLLRQTCILIRQFHATQWQEFGETFFALLAHGELQALQNELHTWWPGDAGKVWSTGLPVEQLAQIVHLFYLALCDAIGPVAADRLLARATAKTAELPEAGIFPPQRLF